MPVFADAGFKLIKPTTPLIDWVALWHIILVSVAGGCGLALLVGIALLGLERADLSKNGGEKAGGFLLGGICLVACAFIVGVGVYVMCNPSKSKPAKVVKTAQVALVRLTA